MNEFEPGTDPLSEPIDDAELRELLERLGEAELGGDERATVGAVVEVTGVDAATVLRNLSEIRHRALNAQRKAFATMERRLARLEARPTTTVRHEYSGTHQRQETEAAMATKAVVAILLAFVFILFALAAGSAKHTPGIGKVTLPHAADDGDILVDGAGIVSVRRFDGSTREPTPPERVMAESLARAVRKDP